MGGPGAGWPPAIKEPEKVAGPAGVNLTPIDPQAAYDPEMAAGLAKMRQFGEQYEQGAGHAADVKYQQQQDFIESEVARAMAQCKEQGIPCDVDEIRAKLAQGQFKAQEEQLQTREAQRAAMLQAESAAAGAQAGERTQRLGIDLQRDVQENQLALQRYAEELKKYGIDVGAGMQRYGIDVGANTAANAALMDFYSRLMSGMFNTFGNMGTSFSNTTYYG